MKLFTLLILGTVLLCGIATNAQTPGDKHTIANGNWTDHGIWQAFRNDSISPLIKGPRWEASGYPETGFTGQVTIGHSVTLDIPMSLPNIVIGQELVLNNHLSLTGVSYFTQAIFTGTSSVDIAAGATCYVYAGFFHNDIVNNGTVELINPSNNQQIYNYATFLNNGVFNVSNPNSGSQGFSGPGTFNNSSTGVLNYNGIGGSVYSAFSLGSDYIINDGVFNSNGTSPLIISLGAGGTATYNGVFHSNGTGGIRFTGNGGGQTTETFSSSSEISGAGPVRFISNYANFQMNGNYSIDSTYIGGSTKIYFNTSSVNFPYLDFTGGVLGGDAVKTISDRMNWTGQTLNGGPLTIQTGATCYFGEGGPCSNNCQANFTNNGTINWINNWYCCAQGISINDATFTNNGVMNMQGSGGAYQVFGGTNGTFINSSTGVMNLYTSSNPFSLSMDYFTNDGTINNYGSSSFSIATNNESTHAGSFNAIGTGGFLFASSGSHIFSPSSSVTGTYIQNNGSTLNFQGIYTIDSTVESYGNVNFNMSSVSARIMWLNGGNIGGSATKTITGAMLLQGNVTGGTVTINPDAYLFMDGYVAINASIVNNGHAYFRTGGQIIYTNIGAGSTFDNNGTFEMELAGGNKYAMGFSGPGTFNNNVTGSVSVLNPNSAITYLNPDNMTNSGVINLNTSKTYFNTYTLGGIINIGIGGMLQGGNLTFTGSSFTNNGSVQTSQLNFTGTSSQQLNGTGDINTFAINNTAGIVLGGTQTINYALTLTNGNITLGNNDLVMGGGCEIYGGSSSSYFVTNGTGAFKRTIYGNGATYLFPIGNVSGYLPATIVQAFGMPSDNFSGRVIDNLFYDYDVNNNPIGSAIGGNVVNHTWLIKGANANVSNASVTLQWNVADESAGFDRSQSRFGQLINGGWAVSDIMSPAGAGPFTITQNNVTSFSPLSVIGQFATTSGSFNLPCRGLSGVAPVTATGTFNAGNIFTVQLSDELGSFNNPVNIGSQSAVNSVSVPVTIPNNTTLGSGYRVRVVSSDPVLTSPDNGTDLEVNTTFTITAGAGTGGSITAPGASIVCLASNKTYTITPSAGYFILDVLVDGVSQGAISSYTFNIIIGDHTIEAVFVRACSVTPARPASILQTLVDNACGARVYRYTAAVTANTIGYKWTLPVSVGSIAGVTVDSGDINSSRIIKLKYVSNNAAINGDSIAVRGFNGCGNGPLRTVKLINMVLRTPGAPASIIQTLVDNSCGARVYRYIAPALTGATAISAAATGWQWSLPVGPVGVTGTIDSGSLTSHMIRIKYPSNDAATIADNISVQFTSNCGPGLIKTVRLINAVLRVPAAPAIFTQTLVDNSCGARIYRYTAPALPAATASTGKGTGYLWSLPVGPVGSTGSLDSGSLDSRFIRIKYTSNDAATTADLIGLSFASDCGYSAVKSIRLINTVLKVPVAPLTITQTSVVDNCGARVYRYIAPALTPATASTAAATGWSWSMPAGPVGSTGSLDSGSLSSRMIRIIYTSNAAAGMDDKITVAYTSDCGNSLSKELKLNNAFKPGCPSAVGNPKKESNTLTDAVQDLLVINLYPNPSSGKFNVEINAGTNHQADAKITITNNMGQLVYTKEHLLVNGKLVVPVELNLGNGIYYVTCLMNNEKSIKKLVINK